MGPGLFWNFPPKAGCTVPQSLLQTMYVGSWCHCTYLHYVPYRATQVSPFSSLCGFIYGISRSSVPFCQSVSPVFHIFILQPQAKAQQIQWEVIMKLLGKHATQQVVHLSSEKNLFLNHNILEQILGIRLGAKPEPETEKFPQHHLVPAYSRWHTVSVSLLQHEQFAHPFYPFNVFIYIRTRHHK